MSSPFSVFRKHQKGLMAGLIIVAMVSFIVLGTVDQFMRQGPGGGTQDTRLVATWSGGKITKADVDARIGRRQVLNQFIYGVAQTAVNNGSTTVPNPRQYSTEEQEVVYNMLLTQEAEKLGVVVPDSQIDDRIKSYSGDAVSDSQLTKVMRDMSARDRPVTIGLLFSAIRDEMMAEQMQALYQLSPNSYDYNATPAERWDYFCRLNRRVKLQVLPVRVEPFINDARIPKPTDAQLAAFYEAHKDEVASPSSPEPGFKDPPGVKLEYIKADYVKFFDKAKAAITEEEIRKDFESRKANLRSSLESIEQMTSRDLLDELDAKLEAEKDPLAVRATEPDATPYEEAVGTFAKRAPRATEPAFTDDEILARNRESIVKRLAEDRARKAMTKALDDTFQAMDRFYSTEYRTWLIANTPDDPNGKAKKEPPKTPAPKFDLAKLARPDEGLTYHQTSMLSFEEIVRDPALGQTFVDRRWGEEADPTTKEVNVVMQQEGTRLANYVFTSKSQMSPFRAEDEIEGTAGGSYRNQYVLWTTDERPEQTLPFAEIKDRVERAWRIANTTGKSARDLARENAQQIADEINGNRTNGMVQTLKERFPDRSEVKETEEFTWYEPHEMPIGTGPLGKLHTRAPTLTKLEAVELGEDHFYREVFRLANRQAGTAMNDAGEIVYVVQVFDSVSSTPEKLREDFQRATFSLTQSQFRQIPSVPAEQGYVLSSRLDHAVAHNAWIEQFERDYDLKWESAPTE
jgi:hypothetical protein